MRPDDIGVCEHCGERVPAGFQIREGRVYLHKYCPRCGESEALVSSDAAVWQAKRDLMGFIAPQPCSMQCNGCQENHHPGVVFLEVTNRCNMNCPICIANVPGMGFDFHPPLEYFERIFAHLATFDPLPKVELFGGEPTVRNDLIDIINLGRKYELRPRVVTNGIRLADEEYCKALCKARVRFRIAIDGRSPEIYQRLRNNPGALAKKLKAIENLKKYTRRKHSLLCCAAKGVNDQAMADLIACCHENMEVFNELALLPLAETWDPSKYEGPPATTPEDAEEMIKNAVPGGGVEFIPAGLTHHLRLLRSFFRPSSLSDRLMFGGAHPNCESLALLASDGTCYRSLNHYFRMSYRQIVDEALEIIKRINPKLARLDPRRTLQRLRGQLIIIAAFLPLARRAVSFKRLFRGHPVLNPLRMGLNVILGRKERGFFYKYMDPPRILGVIILPFEEPKGMNASRLRSCKAAFVYEDVDTGTIKSSPACTWTLYRDAHLKKIAAKYNRACNAEPAAQPVHS